MCQNRGTTIFISKFAEHEYANFCTHTTGGELS